MWPLRSYRGLCYRSIFILSNRVPCSLRSSLLNISVLEDIAKPKSNSVNNLTIFYMLTVDKMHEVQFELHTMFLEIISNLPIAESICSHRVSFTSPPSCITSLHLNLIDLELMSNLLCRNRNRMSNIEIKIR